LAQTAFRLAEMNTAVLDALPANIALVASDGTILTVNEPWRQFADEHSLQSPSYGVGQNYLTICREAQGAHSEEAADAATGLERVLTGEAPDFSLEYPCYVGWNERWFRLMVSPVSRTERAGAVVMHVDVTERKLATDRIRRLNQLHRMAEAINESIVRNESSSDLYARACQAAVEEGGFAMAWAGRLHSRSGEIRVESVFGGEDTPSADELTFTTSASPSQRPEAAALMQGCGVEWRAPELAAEGSAVRRMAEARGYQACAAFPLRDSGHPSGTFALYSRNRRAFEREEMQLLAAMAENLSLALEAHRREAALVESEARYREAADQLSKILDFSVDMICAVDEQGCFLQVNAACETVLGYAPEELVARSFRELVLPEDLERTEAEVLMIKERLVARNIDNRYRRKDGRVAHLQWSAKWSPEEKVFFCVARDVTEAKRAAERVAQRDSWLDQATDAIFVRDLDDVITYWNKSAERIYGWTAAEALGQRAHELLKQGEFAFVEANDEVMRSGEWSGEFDKVARDGRKLAIAARWTLLRDETGEPKQILTINTDVTERKALEQQFLRAQRMESIGTLAGGIAHDLNNVLTPIVMAIDLMKLQERHPARVKTLETMEASARRGADMVKQVLSFARGLESQQLRVDVAALIREIERMANEMFFKTISIHSSIPDDLWAVRGDVTQLHQVLLNMAVNARDAMPDGGSLTLSAQNVMLDEHYVGLNIEAQPGPHVMITVEDTGHGMTADVAQRIFEPFYTTKEIGKGTGLGLSTSLAIVKSHKGFVRVYSEPGNGTRFHIYLPALAGAVDHHLPIDGEMPTGAGELVLVIDDEEGVRRITQQTLEAFGYRVAVAADGAEGVAVFAENLQEVAVVLTDMMMPDMDGAATIRVLLRMKPGVKVIAASGLNVNGIVAKAADAGVTHFIPKPYTAQTLLRTLHEALHPSEQRDHGLAAFQAASRPLR
jgi:PAS domain S-box-containing protein